MTEDMFCSYLGCGFAGMLPKYQFKRFVFIDTYSAFPAEGNNLIHGVLEVRLYFSKAG